MLLLNLLFALAWVFLTGEFTPLNFFIGFFITVAVFGVVGGSLSEAHSYSGKIFKVPYFILFFLYELFMANIKVAFDVLTVKHYMQPGIVAIPLEAKTDIEITLLANLISLTPGTLSIDLSENKSVLYVHAMYIENQDHFRALIKNRLEKRLLEVLR